MVLDIKRVRSSDDSRTLETLEGHIVQPFKHQVGGHAPFCSLPNGHLLKPCDEREIAFYQNIPLQLLPIAPRCCSTIQGTSSLPLPLCCSTCRKEHREELLIPHSTHSPTSLKKRKLSRNFLVLFDLTRDFRLPCVLDLKLGTRQHGDHATPEKTIAQMEKCRSTTSAEMGIRLCGMQLYETSGELITMNKYEGRLLNENALNDVIISFFDHAPLVKNEVIEKVRNIREIIAKLDGVRLFGASLLVIIEGDNLCPSSAEVCVVDFANATCPGFLNDKKYEGPDEGCIKGLNALEHILTR